MNKYVPLTLEEQDYMLNKIGVDSIDDLFSDIPLNIKRQDPLKINESMSEIEVRQWMKKLSDKNANLEDYTSFLGAGSYDHYIPSIVRHIASRSEFYTSYTPYQPEISQGTLQYIFEFQSMMAELTGMDVINASMYDGATATAEGAMMAVRSVNRNKIIASGTMNPEILKVLETYCHFREIELEIIPVKNGKTDFEYFNQMNQDVAAVIVQNPNFYGIIEEMDEIVVKAHENKSLVVMNVDPISLGLIKSPGEYGADIVVGEGQSLGIPQSFGGPYLGFIGATQKLMRKMPGRICGLTEDIEGKRGFVLTLQAREQHIRREKATSNICSNQSLCSLMAVVYLSTMGKSGIKEVAEQCITKANYAMNTLIETGLFKKAFDGPIFKEFTLVSSIDPKVINEALLNNQMIGPLSLGKYGDDLSHHVIFAITEKRSKQEIDAMVQVIREVAK